MAYGDLPESFATHFDGSGQPDAWSTKGRFYSVWFFVIVTCGLWPPVIELIMKKVPVGLLNLPNKAYWTETPARLDHAILIMRTTLSIVFITTNYLLFVMFNEVVNHAQTGNFNFSLPTFLAITIGITIFAIAYPFAALRAPKND